MGCTSSKSETTTQPKTTASKESQKENDYVEGVVCNVEDLNENEMKTFDLEDAGKVLLVKQQGQIHALGTKCTHYGAPLVNGALGDGRIRCQWHGACFKLANGDIEDFPGLDSLPCYQVSVEGSNVKVRAKKTDLQTNKRKKVAVKKDTREAQNIVVIGGGPSGATCIETLRQEKYAGSLTLVCKENALPYDRVKVSKTMDFEIKSAEFRTDEFYKEMDIDVLKGVEAVSVDTSDRTVSLSNGNKLNYDRLYIATGLKANTLTIPGGDLKNIQVLRDFTDSVYTNGQLSPEKEVVVIGSSFIALEAAAYCVNKVKKVTVVCRGNAPFKAFLGERIGLAFKKFFEDKNVHFIMNAQTKKCNGNSEGFIESVELQDGTILQADLLILGIGSLYYTDFLKGSGVDVREDGSIEVNEYLQSNIPNVYVGGDIAYAPVWSYHDRKDAIGHYPLAQYHGRIAALNMLNIQTKAKAVPYFWTMLFGKGLRYAGHGKFDDILYHGDVEDLKFVAFYLDGDEVVATSSCGMDPVVSQFAELLAQDQKLYRKDLEDDKLAWTQRIVPTSKGA